ncbi:MAG: SIS domain-containing protein [Chloroflexota bacterium]
MSATTFLNEMSQLVARIHETQLPQIQSAGAIIAQSIANGRMVHLFGAGHSAIPVMEAFPRIGGFVGFHPLIELPLSFNGQVIGQMGMHQASFLERTRGYANAILENYQLDERDSMIVFSHSGINALPVEMAHEGQKRGLKVITVVSLAHSLVQDVRHPAGRLSDNADVVIDNCVPEGDALVSVDGLVHKVASGSTIAACIIVDALVAETAKCLVELGVEPLVYPSHNVATDAETEAATLTQEERVLAGYRELQRKL